MFDDLSQLMPEKYVSDFLEWQEEKGKRQNAEAIIEWCGKELKLLQDKELRTRRKPGHSIAWREPEVITLNHGKDSKATKSSNEEPLGNRRHRAYTAMNQVSGQEECTCCKSGAHFLHKCKQFAALSPPKRREFCRFERRCYRCLRAGHRIADCELKQGCDQCNKDHHPLLHGSHQQHRRTSGYLAVEGLESQESESEQESENEDERSYGNFGNSYHNSAQESYEACRAPIGLRTIAVKVSNPITGRSEVATALLDDGSNRSVISDKLAEDLSLIHI